MPHKDKDARKECNRRSAKKNRAKWREYNTRWKRSARVRRYGLSFEMLMQLQDSQGGKCAICRREQPSGRRLVIDHDHISGKVRGLLCDLCNTALGKLGDNVEGLQRAINYLRRAA